MVKIFSKVHPNILTLIGLIITCIASLFYAIGIFWVGGIILLIGGCFDTIDGEVARRTGRVSKVGSFLDSCIDRYADFIILFGMFLWYSREAKNYIPTVLILLAILGCFMVSYIRAKAESLSYDCKIGLGERGFRIPFIAIGSLFGSKIFIGFLVILVIITNITGVHRILVMWRNFKDSKV